ncbi:MAG TPA: NAD(+) synthase [Vicinamibacterales bacterium]|nr:NAD(+) synthase [Vicinamibacterales bacterium]
MSAYPFDSLYAHGFVRVSVGIPAVRVADPSFNVERTLALAARAHEEGAAITLFPELGLSAYSNDDLFHQDALLDGVKAAIARVIEASRALRPVIVVGAPLRLNGALFNCALVIHGGRLLGVTPKTYLPNYREFYEKRQFTAGRDAAFDEIGLLGERVPFGNDLVYEIASIDGCAFHVEICEDVWVPIPPSTYAAFAGATLLLNLSASNITIAKADYRRQLCASQSAKCLAAYVYAAAGAGESTTDLAWDGHAMVYENGVLLAESTRFAPDEQLIVADVDVERLVQERMRMTSFQDAGADHRGRVQSVRRISVDIDVPGNALALRRTIDRFPYVPSSAAARDERCAEAYNIQVHGLTKRLSSTGIQKVVIGVSGGLDSTHALIVCVKTMDRLSLPRANVLAFTMPGFATTAATRTNAHHLMSALGVTGAEIDIKPSCRQMLADLGHPFVRGEPVWDVTFENVQAGERTSHLFRLANYHGALVVGTGDLSELALGWCTYGVGDHMSHYNVNASLPKTLIQYLIRWIIASKQFDNRANGALAAILETKISPELVPGTDGEDHAPSQLTEAVIGPFELQDFNLYYTTRFGFRPSKVAFLARHAWGSRARGAWPEDIPPEHRREYSLGDIKHWLEVFVRRFYAGSQFKRSCLPNGPKVGSGGSLSPRADWRAPTDAEADVWLRELGENVPTS